MKAKILILTPVYNDWENLNKLLLKINKIFQNEVKTKFELIVVNDHSSKNYNFKKFKMRMVKKVTILNLFKNEGSQRAIGIGIKYINKNYKNNFKTIIIDSDGQDNPKIISKMLELSMKSPKYSLVIDRGQRKEPLWFKFFYEFYCILIQFFCAKKIRFGNYSLLISKHLKKISLQQELWSAFPPTVLKTIDNLIHLTLDRDKRYSGESKMNFFGLIIHALKVFSALRYSVLIFSTIYLILFYFLFYESKNLIFFSLMLGLLIFNIINFLISFNNKKNFLNAFDKIKIKTF